MKKSTKIITTAVALALVVAAMVVGIYAATAGSATITAEVSWTATAGITFTLDGNVKAYGRPDNHQDGPDASPTTKTLTQQVVTAATSNTASAALAGNLDADFIDESTEGVNNPGKIVYTYTLENTGTQAIKVKLDKAPAEGAEANTSGKHTPAVAYSFSGVTATYSGITTGTVTVNGGATLTITITLSLAASGENNGVNADLDVSDFDAGVTFVMTK